MRILVIENDHGTATWLIAELIQANHQVKHVGTGSHALSAALSAEYDLCICDVQLPDLHGTEIVRALKAQSPMLPVMTLGDGDAQQWEQVCLDAGASCYLQKPLSSEALTQEVKLVEKARLRLTTVIIDTDPIHRRRVEKSLNALGCEVNAFASLGETPEETIRPGCLLVLDGGAEGTIQTLKWAKQRGAACFVFKDQYDAATEEQLMRNGAALLMRKPVDIDQLLTQAAFFAAMG